jgi:Archaeal/vacuolar-type H+-ATPase subunit I
MLLPESMSRVVITGSRSRLDDVTEALYDMNVVHIIDHINDTDEGFSIGAPRPYSSKASERLLKVRAAVKELDINTKQIYPIPSADIRERLDKGGVEEIEKEIVRVADERTKITQLIADLKAKRASLELLVPLGINVDVYSGYESLAVFVGTTASDPTSALSGFGGEVFVSGSGKDKRVVAVFVEKSKYEEVSRALSGFGFAEIPVPAGIGSPSDMLNETTAAIAKQEEELVKTTGELSELRTEYEPFLVATDEELSIMIKKGELPLKIGTSEFSFVVDAWIPTAKIASTEAGLKERLGDVIYFEVQETRGRDLHEVEHAEPRFKTTPTKQDNGNIGKLYEYPTGLVSLPKYQEIDPSSIMAIFFPLFFGFMVGDVGYAIPFIILGAYGLKVAKSEEFRAIATVLFFGGIWAFLFGFFFFGEMLGMHFVGHTHGTVVTWEGLLGITLPDWFSGIMIDGHGIGKTTAVGFLLKLSVYIGIFHLLFSYVIGFINVKIQHGWKEAFLEKGGWILSFTGMVIFCYVLTEILLSKPMGSLEGELLYMFIIGIAILIAGIAVSWTKEKAQAILELPGIIGNILSYTRLAAIGMSKAGMALAFNYMSIVMIAGLGGEIQIHMVIIGALIFLIGHLMIWVLAILSAGLHALRLQYVESMNKFFIGGGQKYEPLAVKRKNTKIVETEV